jgi:hypothetical protein
MYFLFFLVFHFLLLSNSRKLKWRGAGCPDEGQRRSRPPPEAGRCGHRLAPLALRIQRRRRRLGDLVRASCRLFARTTSQTLCKYFQSFRFSFFFFSFSIPHIHLPTSCIIFYRLLTTFIHRFPIDLLRHPDTILYFPLFCRTFPFDIRPHLPFFLQ